jgi:hypothetical protein
MEKLSKDIKRMYEERLEDLAYQALVKPSVKELDFDCLRDFLIDICAATQSEVPPSQEEWNEIRERTKKAAAEHAEHYRDKKRNRA